jgi:hypothetical protein
MYILRNQLKRLGTALFSTLGHSGNGRSMGISGSQGFAGMEEVEIKNHQAVSGDETIESM